MILRYAKKSWFAFVFTRYRTQGMIVGMLTMGVLAAGLAYLQVSLGILNFRVPNFFHTVLGIVVGLLLVFRTNTPYDRWWEGRVRLNELPTLSRVLASRFDHYLPEDTEDQRRLIGRLIPAYSWSLRQWLREGDFSDHPAYLPEELNDRFVAAINKPMFVLEQLTAIIAGHAKKESIPAPGPLVLENQILQLADVQGACERIRTSPIPLSYTPHLKRILFFYLPTLPFGFVHDLAWYSIPAVMLVFFMLVGIEAIGEEIDDPFGTDLNDIPFDDVLEEIT
ncbi:MAG: bestrophin family protein, partial [bacterium]